MVHIRTCVSYIITNRFRIFGTNASVILNIHGVNRYYVYYTSIDNINSPHTHTPVQELHIFWPYIFFSNSMAAILDFTMAEIETDPGHVANVFNALQSFNCFSNNMFRKMETATLFRNLFFSIRYLAQQSERCYSKGKRTASNCPKQLVFGSPILFHKI